MADRLEEEHYEIPSLTISYASGVPNNSGELSLVKPAFPLYLWNYCNFRKGYEVVPDFWLGEPGLFGEPFYKRKGYYLVTKEDILKYNLTTIDDVVKSNLHRHITQEEADKLVVEYRSQGYFTASTVYLEKFIADRYLKEEKAILLN